MDLISVIIPAYNYADYIEETLQSVADQIHANLECIVIDDGSTDLTRATVEAFCARDDRFHYYHQTNQGLASARNAGLMRSCGNYISFLDADDLWTNTKLSNQIQIFNEQGCDVVFSDCLTFSREGEFHTQKKGNRVFSPSIFDFVNVDLISGSSSSVTIKRVVFEKIGLFDVNLRSLEDLDYWFRTALGGFRFSFCDAIDVKIRVHGTGMSANHLKMYQYHFVVLEKQLKLLTVNNLLRNVPIFRTSMMGRLGRIRWYASELRRYDLCLNVHLFGFNFLRFSYFNRLNCMNFFKDSFLFLFHSNAKKNK